MDWLAVRAVLRPIIEAQEGRASMRAIQEKTGIAPSTLVRWKEEVNRPVDLGKVVTALELFGESPAAFFVAVEHRASLVTDPVTGTDQGSVPHHGGIPDVPKPERAAIQREVAMLLTEITAVKLASVKPGMLRADYRRSPEFVEKARRLHAAAPDMAAIVERLLDELLEDCG